jgi:diguanylate cyclase (GGDEF)-like protein
VRDRRLAAALAVDVACLGMDEQGSVRGVFHTLAVGARRLAEARATVVLTRVQGELVVEATSGEVHLTPSQRLAGSTAAEAAFGECAGRTVGDPSDPLVEATSVAVRLEPVLGLGRPVALLAVAGGRRDPDTRALLRVIARHAGLHAVRLWDGEMRHDLLEQRAAAMTALRRMADTDSLTGLANRAGVLRVLDSLVTRHQAVGVVYVDLDGFKQVNDHYGHSAGDEVLRQVAGRLRDLVRPTDVVGRLGGDEFVLVLPDADAPAAQAVLDRLPEALAPPVRALGVAIDVHASSGLAVSHGELTTGQLLQQADRSMYDHKASPGQARLSLIPPQPTRSDH